VCWGPPCGDCCLPLVGAVVRTADRWLAGTALIHQNGVDDGTDVIITTIGDSARPFLESWDLLNDEDDSDPPLSAQEQAENADWLHDVKEELGPSWHPGTALIRVRTSAPEGIVEAIRHRPAGGLPA